MSSLLVLVAGFGFTAMAGDLAVRGRKLQSALGRIALVQVIGLGVVMAVISRLGGLGALPILVFWSGAFLSWFGVRSHLESSILLRMVHMLYRGPMTGREVMTEYASKFGRSERLQELVGAGLLERDPGSGAVRATGKGRRIARLVERLR
jgi:hypothetical protein